jgi:hypothetical protein
MWKWNKSTPFQGKEKKRSDRLVGDHCTCLSWSQLGAVSKSRVRKGCRASRWRTLLPTLLRRRGAHGGGSTAALHSPLARAAARDRAGSPAREAVSAIQAASDARVQVRAPLPFSPRPWHGGRLAAPRRVLPVVRLRGAAGIRRPRGPRAASLALAPARTRNTLSQLPNPISSPPIRVLRCAASP